MSMQIMVVLAVLAIIVESDVSMAQSRTEAASPNFTPGEQAIIDRNAALAAIIDSDPGLVRRVLDSIEAAQAGSGSRSSVPRASRSGRGRRQKTERPPDPNHNPDLDQLGRLSPEAAHDLFQLIKNASKGTNKRLER
jgi:hypothetical protein